MPTTIKYIGTTSNWFESHITGKQSNWEPGQQEERSDAEAGLLLATGLFSTPSMPVTAVSNPLTGGISLLAGGEMALSTLPGALFVAQADGVDNPVLMAGNSKSAPSVIFASQSVADVMAKSAPFGGWGCRYSAVAGMRFSHIFISQINQTAASAVEKWSRVDFKVKATDRNGALIASGSVYVGGYANTIANQYVKLYDAAGAEKIVVDSDLVATYWIEAIAYNKNGDRCPMGVASGLTENYIPLSTAYYLTTTGVWTDTVSNTYRLGFQPAYYSTQTALPAAQPPIPDLLLAPIYAVVGREASVYFSGLSNIDPSRLDWDVAYTGNNAQHQNERFTVTPDAAGTFSLTISAIDPISGVTVSSASTSVYVAAAAAVATPTLLCIGDSTTAGGEVTGELVVIDTADANIAVTLVGTKGTNPNKFEATSGWSTTSFTTAGSPFYISSVVDVAAYLANNSLSTPTHVIINLGINDVFAATTDGAATLAARTAVANIAKLIAATHAASATAKIGVAFTTAPSDNQDAFGNTANYATGQNQRRYKRNWSILGRQLIDAFGGKASTLVWLLPYNCSNSPMYNMTTVSVAVNSRNSATVVRQNNGVHPASSGYLQIADVVYAWLKNNP